MYGNETLDILLNTCGYVCSTVLFIYQDIPYISMGVNKLGMLNV